MSHVVDIDITINDLEAIKAMCKRQGWEFVENATTYKWYGHFVGNYAMPEGYTEADLGKCIHKIKVPGCTYEIGIAENKNGPGYRFMFDFWKSGGLKEVVGKEGYILKQLYAVEKTKIEAQKRGYRVTEKKQGKKFYLTIEGKW